MAAYDDLRRECFEANIELPKLGLVIYTFGNVSVIDRASGTYAIKPSGVPYETMGWQDMVIVDLDDNVVDGKLRPSSDAKTHTVLYRAFAGVGGIVHTHSTHAVAWSQARRDVPIYGTTHADHLASDIPCTDPMDPARIAGDYEVETGRQILEAFERKKLNPAHVEMVLVAGHGPFTWGKTGEKAVYNSRVLEELCRMAILTEKIATTPKRLEEALIRKHFERKHGKNAYYGQNDPKA